MTKARTLTMVALGLLSWSGVAAAGGEAGKSAKSRDARIEARLDADLLKDKRLADKVDAKAHEGKVTLTGSVETEADKVRAGQLARTSGAKAVDNQVAVASTEQPAAAVPQPAPGESRALSDPQRKDPLVGSMPAEQAGSREMRLRTMGMEDPKVKKQREQQAAPAPAPEPAR